MTWTEVVCVAVALMIAGNPLAFLAVLVCRCVWRSDWLTARRIRRSIRRGGR